MAENPQTLLPHPLTGRLFPSPVPPGTGWPEDPARADTPVARDAARVRELAAGASDVEQLNALCSVCRTCERLVEWREDVAEHKRASFAGEPYWGRPVPSYGDPMARLVIVGLAPAANETVSTAGDGQTLRGVRMIAPVRCAPPANKPAPDEKAACSGWFEREIALLPHLASMLALGGIAWHTTLAAAARMGWDVPRPRPKFGHGAVARLRTPEGRTVRLVGCYHT